MELLREYASDSDSDSSVSEAPTATAADEQQVQDTLALPLHSPPAPLWIAPPPEPHPQHHHPMYAIADMDATRLVEQVQQRRMTRDEQTFEFRGYVSKRRRRCVDPVRLESPQSQSQPQPCVVSEATSVRTQLFDTVNDAKPTDNSDDSDDDTRRPRLPMSTLPTRAVRTFRGHTGAVNCVRWNETKHTSLFLSASMDGSVRIWHHKQEQTCRRTLTLHTRGVKSARWSSDGARVLSGSYDGRAIYADAETGKALQTLEPHARSLRDHHVLSSSCAVTSVCAHPSDVNMFLVGTDRGCIFSYDMRQRAPCRTFQRGFGDVLDLLFLPEATGGTGGAQFVSSAGVRYRDASHQTLLVWDFASSALLSDRLDRDMQPFQCLRLHPREPRFVAQASADYALFFAATAPYKRSKKGRSRFAGGHEVQGFGVQCSFSADGAVLATGDANGRVFLYDTTSKCLLRRIEAFSTGSASGRTTACLSAEFQPALVNSARHERARLVAGSFDGRLVLYE